jgi:hypothetical protein
MAAIAKPQHASRSEYERFETPRAHGLPEGRSFGSGRFSAVRAEIFCF